MGDGAIIYDKITTENVVFTRADNDIRRLIWRLNGEVFAPPLELDAYEERKAHLSQQALTKNGRCTYYVLAHKQDRTHILASCEAIKKTVFIAGRDTGLNGGFVEATGYSVASIYTNPKHRRLGMAAHMLRKLQEQLDRESECSALYSDIGKMYYAHLGWDAFPSAQATIHLHAEQPFRLPAGSRTHPLTLDDLPALCARDVAQLRARFQRLAADHATTHVAFAPDFAQVAWQLARADVGMPAAAAAVHGKPVARRGAATHGGRGWVYWTHSWEAKQLTILRLVLLDVDPGGGGDEEEKARDVLELLQAAAAEAAAWGLEKVLVWNPDATTTRGIKGFHDAHGSEVDVIFDERTDAAVPCFRWKGGHGASNTVWEENHYYAWC